MRELLWMAEGRRRDEWRRTARVCSVLANIHRDTKTRPTPFSDEDFNDYAAPRPPERRIKASITILKGIFLRPETRAEPCRLLPFVPVPRTSS